jgi:hypothetical protein
MPQVLSRNGSATPTARAGAPLPTRERKPGYVAMAVLLIVGLAALFGFFYQQAGSKQPVVVVAREVPAGHVLQREDLSTVDVAGGVVAIAGANLESVLGQVATVPLLPNTLLQRSMVTDENPLTADEARVGVALKSGQIPAEGVQPGDVVQVVQLPADGQAPAANDKAAKDQAGPPVLVDRATVYAAAEDPALSGGTLLTLVVPADMAPLVAVAGAAGRVAVIAVRP